MFHLHDLFHSVSNQCYRMLIICSPDIFFSSVAGQNLWLIASNAGHKLLWQIYPVKAVLYLEENVSFPTPTKSKTEKIKTFQNDTEINLVTETEVNLPSAKD